MADDFATLPKRIFLDSSTLQALQVYGEFIYENVEPEPTDRIRSISGGYEELDALRAIIFVGKRAQFELALSLNSFDEVTAKHDAEYLQWAYEVLAYWNGYLAAYHGRDTLRGTQASKAFDLNVPRFRYLSAKDRALLQDALSLECDAFLTLDRKLAKNSKHIDREVGLRVLLPTEFWDFLKPWARLFI